MGNLLSISVSPGVKMIGKRYFDLSGTVELMGRLWQSSVAYGFKIQNLAAWAAATPTRDEGAKRLAAWQESEKYTVDEAAEAIIGVGVGFMLYILEHTPTDRLRKLSSNRPGSHVHLKVEK
jgi:hypothetical protein